MLTPESALQKRDQLIEEGYCVVEDILPADFLAELRQATDTMLDSVEAPPHWKYQGSDLHVRSSDHPAIARLIAWQPARDALEAMGLGDFKTRDAAIVLSKPPGGHALYWHQDWTGWNDPISAAPWVQYIFLSYYIVDTTPENGCFQVIPGTHRKRIPLHEKLVPAHAEGGYNVPETDPDMFCEHPDAIDVPVKAGALVIGEGRVLHAARANQSDQRRTLLLIWHDRPATVPAYWHGDIPEVIQQRDPNASYPSTRVPGIYLP